MSRFDRIREDKEKLEAYKRKLRRQAQPVVQEKKNTLQQQSGISEKSASLIAEALRMMMKGG